MKRYLTPGPTELYPTIPAHLERILSEGVCSISHRSPAFHKIYERAAIGVRELLGAPSSFQVLFLGSATEAMERLVQGASVKNTLHLVNGSFSSRFHKIASAYDREAKKIEVPMGKVPELPPSVDELPELICVTQNETSTGAYFPVSRIGELRELVGEAPFVAVDIVSSAPIVELDFSVIDAAFFSVQKCFGLPAGLGVLLVNERLVANAKELASHGEPTGGLHSISSLAEAAAQFQTPATPNVLGISLLGSVAEDIADEGIQAVRNRILDRAKSVYKALESSSLNPFISELLYQSPTVVTIDSGEKTAKFREALEKRSIVPGSGYKDFKQSQLRIANFLSHRDEDIESVVQMIKEFS